MALTERLALLIDARVDGAVRDIKGLAKEAGRTEDSAKKLEARGKAIGTAWKVGAGVVASAALVKMAQLSGKAVEDASALSETVNKVGVVFGDQADKVLAFGDNAAKSLGQSKQQAIGAAATFGQFFEAAGQANDQAADMSLTMVKLASDMASFNDADPSEVLENLRSGLSGEAEPLRKFGVFLNESAVAAKAAELGLQGVNGKLTDGEKIQARYALIMEQTAKAQGDFERTSDGLANKQRQANALMEDASAALGEGLLPAQLAVTNALVEAAPAITTVAKSVGGMVEAFSDLPGPVQAVVAATTALAGGYLLLAPRIAETKKALRDLGTEAPRTARVMGAVGRAAGAAAAIIALDAALKGLNSRLDENVPGMEELTSRLLDLKEGKVDDLGNEFKGLAENIDKIGTGGLSSWYKFADSIPLASGAMAAFNNVLPGESTQEKFRTFQAQLESIDGALSNLASSGSPQEAEAAFTALASSLNLSAYGQEQLRNCLPKFQEALKAADNQTRLLTGATDGLSGATKAASGPTKEMTERQAKLAEKLREARKAARDTAGEFVGLGDSLDDGKVSLNQWLHQMEKSTQALAQFRENAKTAARRGLDEGLIASLQDAGAAGALRMRQLANATDAELKRANKAWRDGEAEMRRWVNFEVPVKHVGVDVDTEGAKREFEGFVASIAGRRVVLGLGVNSPEARASGGPVTGGDTYLVGEKGPELFVPRQSGTIVPNGSLSRSTGGRQVGSSVDTYAKSLDKVSTITEKLAKHLLEAADQIRDGFRDRIRDLRGQRAQTASSFASSFGQTVFGGGATSVSDILKQRGAQASDAVALNQAITALIGKGVSEDVLRELAAGGQAGFDQIKLLAGADKTQLAEFNKLTGIANSNLAAAGSKVGGALFDDDIAAARVAEKMAQHFVGVLERALEKKDKDTVIHLHLGAKEIRTSLLELKRKSGGNLGLA